MPEEKRKATLDRLRNLNERELADELANTRLRLFNLRVTGFLAEAFTGQWKGRVRWEFEGASATDYDFSKNLRLE